MGTAVLGESLASRHVDVMIDDDEVWAHYLASRQRLGSVAYYLFVSRVTISLFPFFFFFPSLVPLSLSSLGLLLSFVFLFYYYYFIYMGHGLSEFFFFLHGSWALASWAG